MLEKISTTRTHIFYNEELEILEKAKKILTDFSSLISEHDNDDHYVYSDTKELLDDIYVSIIKIEDYIMKVR